MKKSKELIEKLKKLLASQQLAVLATHNKGEPYTNLVGFVETDDLKTILFATTRDTRKYGNIKKDSRVSVLIDNRSHKESDFINAIAATATGNAEETRDEEKEKLLTIYLKRHPSLEKFASSPTCAFIKVRVEKYYVVERFQNVTEIYVK